MCPGKGYVAGHTTGNTSEGGATSKAAASYGGLGEMSPGASTNAVYGSYTDPDDWGSGGGGPDGGSGGGLVRIQAESLTVIGQILANGQEEGGFVNGDGSGGGIYISVKTLSGTGIIKARGGSGSYPAGGGRIAVYANDYSGFDVSRITSQGSSPASDSVEGSGAGTIYVRDPDEPSGTLIIDGLDGSGPTPLGLPGDQNFVTSDSVVIRGIGAYARPEHPGMMLEFQNSLTVTGSGALKSTGGLILNGTAYLGSPDDSLFGSLDFVGTQTLQGAGTIVFGGNTGNAINNSANNGDTGTLTIGSGITIRGNQGSVGNSDLPLVNQGIIAPDVNSGALTLRSSNLSNTGTIEAKNGSKLTSLGGALTSTGFVEAEDTSTVVLNNGSVTFDSPGVLVVQPTATAKIGGSIFGDTTNTSLFQPGGVVSLSGTGTSAVPQFIEVMGQDLGNVSAGFNNNFAYASLSLSSNDYVRLVDLQKNRSSSEAEALYVNTLVVPSGATLDLNGLNLYYRVGQISGTVTAGSATPLLGGGPILLNSFAPGNLQVTGEVDDWNFFGRAGQLVDILLHTGSSGTPAPISPNLGFGQITLLDPSGKVVDVAANSQAGVDASILNQALPADGTYHLVIQAEPASSASTGNYVLSAYDAGTDTSTLELNQNAYGQLNSPYSQHRWTFSATANSQITFNMLAAQNSSIRFDLTGPGSYVGFTGASTSSDLITLPISGTYTISASGGPGAYAFRLDETSLTDLTLETPYQGTLVGDGDAQLFRVDITQTEPFLVALQDASAADHDEVYLKLGSPPTRSTYDYRQTGTASATDIVLVPSAAPGTWYVLVYGASVPQSSDYTLTARSSTVVLTSMTPDHYAEGTDAILTVSGAGFDIDSQVQLVGADGTSYDADSTGHLSDTQLTATFSGGEVPSGVYTVVVTTGNGDSAGLPGGLTIGGAAQEELKTRVILPSFVGYHLASTLYVEYSNTGTVAMEAPLLLLTATQDGQSGAIMTLDPKYIGQGFITSSLPSGFSNEVQILASGSTPGYLLPGESIRVPVYYAGWQQPWDFTYPAIQFNLSIYRSDDDTPIDWSQQGPLMRPAGVDDQTWSNLFSLIQAYAGGTWGDYVNALSVAVQQSDSTNGKIPTVQQSWQTIINQGQAVIEDGSTVGSFHLNIGKPLFSPKGEHLAFVVTDGGGSAVIEDGAIVGGYHQGITSLTFSPDGQHLAFLAADPSGAGVIEDGAIVGGYHQHVTGLTFSRDSKHLAFVVTDANRPAVIEDGAVVGGYHQGVTGLTFSPYSNPLDEYGLELMSWGDNSTVPTSGKNLVIVGTDNDGLLHIRIFDASGNLTDTDETNLPSTRAGAISDLKQQLPGLLPPHQPTDAEKAQVLADVASIIDRTHLAFLVADASGGAVIEDGAVVGGYHQGVTSLTFSPDSNHLAFLVANASGGAVIEDGVVVGGYHQGVTSLTFSPDSNHLAFLVADASGGAVIEDGAAVGGYHQDITGLTFSPDGQHLAFLVADPSGAGVIEDGTVVGGYHQGITSLTFSPDGQHLAFLVADPSGAGVIEDGTVVGGYHQGITSLTFSPDGQHLAFLVADPSGDGVIEDGTVVGGYHQGITSLTFSLDGQHLAFLVADASGAGVIEDGTVVGGYHQGITSLAFSRKSNHLAFLVADPSGAGVIEDGAIVGGYHQGITSLTFSPDGQHLAFLVADPSGAGVIEDGIIVGGYHKRVGNLVFSADSEHIAFVVSEGGGGGGPVQPMPPLPPPGPGGGGGTTSPVGSHDPNALIGPAGFGAFRYITTDTLLPYQIDFENASTATAPAQRVAITDQLDANLDWGTLELTGLGFGETNIAIPANSQYFATTVPVTENGKSFDVQVEVQFDSGTGLLTATFQSIDPSTQLPPDLLTGFLPPEDGTGRGMGYISFIVDPKAGLPTGDEIRNVARITFDANPAIATDQVDEDDPSKGIDAAKQSLNTIDSGAPTSSVSPLPPVETSTKFTVSWSGQDDTGGSGIAFYDIYVSEDGGPFTPLLLNFAGTTATFTGLNGHTYSFYTVATDNVGQVETPHSNPDTTTQIQAAASYTTATTLQTSDGSSTYGDSLIFTATVSATPGAGTPTGTVRFLV